MAVRYTLFSSRQAVVGDAAASVFEVDSPSYSGHDEYSFSSEAATCFAKTIASRRRGRTGATEAMTETETMSQQCIVLEFHNDNARR